MNGTADFEQLRVRDLFALSPENPGRLAANLKPGDFKKIEAEASSFSEPMAWDEVRTGLAGAIIDALDLKVIDGWVSAWQKWEDVKEKAEMSRKSSSPVECKLLEHSIESSFHPYIEVFLGHKLVQKINFEVRLTTTINVAILALKSGSLVSIQPCRCEWLICIEIEDGPEVFKEPLTRLDLPGSIVLRHPIPLYSEDEVSADRS